MANLSEVYKCQICGNIVEVIHDSIGSLACCGQPMLLLKENTVDASLEKHVPVIEETEEGILVKIGSISHPMEEKHYIEFIEVITKDNKNDKKFLKPGDESQAEFCIPIESVLNAREYCNLHGLWKSS